MPEKIIAYIDGGSRGNPGPAAAGFTLTDSAGSHLQAKALFIGRATNNVAEYTALVKALEAAKRIGAEQLTVFSDSELLVRQINGQYKVKSEQIRPLFQQALDLLGQFNSWKVRHVTRDKNKEADKLVNQALNQGRDVEGQVSPAKANSTGRLAAENPHIQLDSSCDNACNIGDEIEHKNKYLEYPKKGIDCYVERFSGDREPFAVHSVDPITGEGTDQERENQ